MKEKINTFLYTTPLIYVTLISAVLIFIPAFTLSCSALHLTILHLIYISTLLALFFSVFISAVLYLVRCSIKFWERYEEVEKLVDRLESKEELSSFYNNEFSELRKLAFARVHYAKLFEVYTIVKTKYKYTESHETN